MHRAGFTLLELLVVLAIAAVLLSLAVPSYRQQALRAHRADAATQLLQLALCQERLRAVQGLYQAGSCLPVATARYAYRLDVTPAPQGRSFQAQALPQGAQADDACGSLILEHTGARQVGGENADPRRCWSGR